MSVTQISVFLENRPGRLHHVTSLLGKSGINIRAMSVADTSEFGILRLIVDRPAEAVDVLRRDGLSVSETEVIGIEIPDRPGGLAGVLKHLSDAGINVEYLYAFIGRACLDAVVLLKVEDIEGATRALAAGGIRVLPADVLYRL